jgi:hypothetical protein
MTKKGPLGKAEEYYVEGHYKEQDAKQIAKDLDRPIVAIQRRIDKLQALEAPTRIKAGDQMARREGVVTMTETASSISDATRKADLSLRTRGCVTQTKVDADVAQEDDE